MERVITITRWVGALFLFALSVLAFTLNINREAGISDYGRAPMQSVVALERKIDAELTSPKRNGDRLTDLAKALDKKAPLHPLPFDALLSTKIATQEKDERIADFAKQTIRRDARNLPARIYLFESAAASQDWTEALDQFELIYTLWPDERSNVAASLIPILSDKNARTEIIDRLNAGAAWSETFLDQISGAKMDLSLAIDLFRPFPENHWQLLRSLVRQNRYDDAYQAWTELRGRSATAEQSVPFDAQFLGSTSPPPFNWSINENHAEFALAGGLHVSYVGRGTVKIAEQLLKLPRGQHTFSVDFEGRIPEAGGKLMWSLNCAESRESIFEQSAHLLRSSKPSSTNSFEVPQKACDFQYLRLMGQPGEYPQLTHITLNSVSIEQLGQLE